MILSTKSGGDELQRLDEAALREFDLEAVLALRPGVGEGRQVLEAERCLPMPDAMPFEEAAAFIMTYGTSLHALKDRGRLKAGESLSALARAFFYAGSRSLLATHWSLNDAAAEQLVAGLLQDYRNNAGDGLAQSLRAAQLALVASAGRDGMPANLAHPFFWAPMALIGESGAPPPSVRTAVNIP